MSGTGWHFVYRPWHNKAMALLTAFQAWLVESWVHTHLTAWLVGNGHIDPYAITSGLIVGTIVWRCWRKARKTQ